MKPETRDQKPEYSRKRRDDNDAIHAIEDMLPEEFDATMRQTDLAIIPIGSIEMHGPNLVNGCDGYITLAKAREVARLTGGVLFPMISYCWEGATNVFSGGVGVREDVFVDYLQAVVRAARKAGFRRILVMNSHGGNWCAMRSFPQKCLRDDGIAIVTTYGTAFCEEAEKARAAGRAGEQECLLGSLRLLGREDLVEDIVRYTKQAIAEVGDRPKVQHEPPCVREARKLGSVGFDYFRELNHVQPDSRQLDADAGAEIILAVSGHIAKHLDAMGDYVDETERGR